MQTFRYTMPQDFNLYLFGDNHEGSILRARENFYEMRERILEDKKAYCIDMGDQAEAICVDDKRYDVETDAHLTPLKQCDAVIEDYKPLRRKMLCMLDGNHPFKLQKVGNLCRDYMCDRLGTRSLYGTYVSFITFNDKQGNQMFKMYCAHGFGRINSVADDPVRKRAMMQLQLKRKLKDKAGDCLLMAMGHSHKLLVTPPAKNLYIYHDGEKIRQAYTHAGSGGDVYIPPESRWYVNTGSFLKLYGPEGVSGYAERFGYDPVELGYAIVEVRDGNITNVREVIQ